MADKVPQRMRRSCLNVGVTGVHIASAPKSGAVVLRELAGQPTIRPIALADYPQTCALGWSRWLSAIYLVPQGILGPTALCRRLVEIARQHELDVVLPCDDEDVLAIAIGQLLLSDGGIGTLLPQSDSVEAVKKENLLSTLNRLGLPAPSQQTIFDVYDSGIDGLDYPVVVKGRLIHSYFARTADEVRGFVSKLSDVWGFPVIIQKFLDGAEFSVCAIADRQHRLAGLCAIRKQGISDQGKTWSAVTIDPSQFEPLVTVFVKELEWVGPVELEFIAASDGSEPKIIEVNPRFPAWIPVSRHAGADLVKRALDLCLGRDSGEILTATPGMCFARTYVTGTFGMTDLAKLYAHRQLQYGSKECPDEK